MSIKSKNYYNDRIIHQTPTTALDPTLADDLTRLIKRVLCKNGKTQISLPRPSHQETMAWCGGFFDGDGCITISRTFYRSKRRGNYWNYSLCAIITQNDRQMLEEFRDSMQCGGHITSSIKRSYHRRQCWVLTYGGESAAGLLDKMLPYLKRKQQEAVLGIKFQQHKAALKAIKRHHACPAIQEEQLRKFLCMSLLK